MRPPLTLLSFPRSNLSHFALSWNERSGAHLLVQAGHAQTLLLGGGRSQGRDGLALLKEGVDEGGGGKGRVHRYARRRLHFHFDGTHLLHLGTVGGARRLLLDVDQWAGSAMDKNVIIAASRCYSLLAFMRTRACLRSTPLWPRGWTVPVQWCQRWLAP